MEFVEIIELTSEIAKLRYYPEQNEAVGEYGEVTYFRKTDDWEFDKIAEGYLSSYAMHAVNFVRRQKNVTKKSGIVAWY